jgi:hypothetical protein
VLGGPAFFSDLSRMAVWEADLARRDALRWLKVLAVRSPEDAVRIAERLRLSKAASARIAHHVDIAPLVCDERATDAAIYREGGEAVIDSLLLHLVHHRRHGRVWEKWVETSFDRARDWRPPAFPIKANDMMSRGVKAGPAMGEALRRAEQLWLDAGLPADQVRLASIADAAARS